MQCIGRKTFKRYAGNAIVNRKRKPAPKNAQHAKHQEESPGGGSFVLLSGSYGSLLTPVGPLDAEKVAEAAWLFVSTIAFPASLLGSL